MTTLSTPPATPDRQRSLGASLLDQVLAETLDPSYVQAAERKAREAAERAEAGEVDPARGGPARRRGQRREALAEDIQQESATTDELADQLADLTVQVNRQRDAALAASAVGQRALAELTAAEQAAALTAVRGPGLEVVVGNAAPASDTDPVGGSESVPLAGLVQDRDLQQVVNALWAAGAEAISINGQRLGPTTTIRQAGSAILVDFRPLSSPYRVRAIGDQARMYNRFLKSPEANFVAGTLAKDYGITFTVGRDKDLSLPAGTAPELRSARPLGQPDAAGTTTDPTPGG